MQVDNEPAAVHPLQKGRTSALDRRNSIVRVRQLPPERRPRYVAADYDLNGLERALGILTLLIATASRSTSQPVTYVAAPAEPR